MASDIHAHPQDLLKIFPGAETERRSFGIACAASSCGKEEFFFHEELAAAAKKDGAPPFFLCFAIHPQLPALFKQENFAGFQEQLDLLAALAGEKKIAAVGETGFDLYSLEYRETEKIQDELFAAHLTIAQRHNLPVILHVRRAMHKIFPRAKILKKLPAVIFHSWSGSPDEASSLLRKGIPAYFSFGTTLLLNHKNSILSCAAIPIEHLLLETDAPYQPLRGGGFSSWADMPAIIKAASAIRKEGAAKQGTDAKELEHITDSNFAGLFI
ncbi:MAG: TatD family hydrolase [Treponema sp.]|nr:TatD family hydrolase [Treponema sp.]